MTRGPARSAAGVPDYESGKTLYEFTVVVSDGELTDSVDVTLDIDDLNEVPEVSGESLEVFSNSTAVSFDVLGNDVDADGDTLELVSVSADRGATVSIDSETGQVSYTPLEGYEGTETITYTVSDGRGGVETGTVTVSVTSNEAPEHQFVSAYLSIPENIDTTMVIHDGSATDVDGDVLSYSLSGEDAGISLCLRWVR